MPTGDILDIVFKILIGVATVAGPAFLWVLRTYNRNLHLQQSNDQLSAQVAAADEKRTALSERYDRLRAVHDEARTKFYRIKDAYLNLRAQPALAPVAISIPEPIAERARIDQLESQVETAEAERDTARQQVEELESRIAEVARFDGRLWLRPPAATMAPFRPRDERRTVIISVLNLKGGVGKTTITANLAATLAKPDAPALMIDLDYQRSLSMMLVADGTRKLLHDAGKSVQHFLGATHHALGDLTRRVHDLDPELANCGVLTNSDWATGGAAADSLEETENRLMAEWLFDPSRPDPRFFLREALHGTGVGRAYSYVLLDCPPRLTTACVNALAASDFVLIPVLPDAVSTRAVENLLRTLKQLQESFLPDLAVLAVVPNMVKLLKGKPILSHAKSLDELRILLNSGTAWEDRIPIAKSVIKQDSEFGQSAAAMDASGNPRLAIANEKIGDAFRALARELEKEIDRHESRRSEPVPPKSGARARSGR